MGKKSSGKKNRQQKVQSTVRHQAAARKEMVIPSLSGGQVAPVNPAAPTTKPLDFGSQTEFIRSDILRITLLLVIVGIILIGLTVANQKTAALSNVGSHLSSFLRLQ